MNKVFSDFFSLNVYDLFKGAITSVLSSVLAMIYNLINESGSLPSGAQWKTIAVFGLTTFLGYLLKNLFSNSDGTVAKTETPVRSINGKTRA